MSCLDQVISYLSFTFEQLGLYEPEIKIEGAKKRLSKESRLWTQCQGDRDAFWNHVQKENNIDDPLPVLVERAISHLDANGIKRGVAVDLGCGIDATTFQLLERGWKVYAVDSSQSVMNTLTEKVSSKGKDWIRTKQLILVNQTIEEFEFPEKVNLIVAMYSLSYCNPEKIQEIFLKIKGALLPKGVLVCNLFPYHSLPVAMLGADNMFRNLFGGWMTTRNVVNAVIRSIDFTSVSVTEEMSPKEAVKEFHIFAFQG